MRKMMKTISYDQIKDRALRILARRDHSARELRLKLKQRIKIEDDKFDQLLGDLKRLGYMVDEGDLTCRWVRQWRSEGRGRYWISGKLKSKGLPVPNLKDDSEELEAARLFLSKKTLYKELKGLP